ncbi:hypothetical protein ATL39_0194 [Sinobaca qinghaiensis]|uniref:CAAX prenyl protease 2/Lysostaphin resistance protein A-like domain-containing protein n=1 Tax=Sinobaca qinghaiensis TaxID=342944 RepID=A0A419V7B5_9BACL|nr:CPBP family glutamic-type intramembrane protease [Sinobaca qinghaiensis]RKD75984.1 hypothetical protein ATL39_0194 [Sinobaca qinghaiensis]
MNKIITSYDLKWTALVYSLVLLLLVFFIDLTTPQNSWIFIVKIVIVPFLAVVALLIAFGRQGIKDIFSKPIKPYKNFFVWYIIMIIMSLISGILLSLFVNTPLRGNPGTEHLAQTFISLPFVLLFEEIISFFFLLAVANIIYKRTKNLFWAQAAGVAVSAVIFGLLHYTTYYNGNMVDTLAHIIFIQGMARVFLNLAGLKSNSLMIPWIIHVVFDLNTFLIGTTALIIIYW